MATRVLGDFFKIWIVFIFVLVTVNISIVAFGETMTGESNLNSGLIDDSSLTDATVTSISGGTISIEQTELTSVRAKPPTDSIQTLESTMINLQPHAQVLNRIFSGIDPSSETDAAQRFGVLLIGLLTAFIVAGIAYFAFSLISIPLGGGSP